MGVEAADLLPCPNIPGVQERELPLLGPSTAEQPSLLPRSRAWAAASSSSVSAATASSSAPARFRSAISTLAAMAARGLAPAATPATSAAALAAVAASPISSPRPAMLSPLPATQALPSGPAASIALAALTTPVTRPPPLRSWLPSLHADFGRQRAPTLWLSILLPLHADDAARHVATCGGTPSAAAQASTSSCVETSAGGGSG